MAGNTYLSPAGRINKYKGEILAHALPKEVLGITGQMKKIPKNSGDNVVYRRYLPYGATTASANTINRWTVDAVAHLLQEGVTPNAESISVQDVAAQLQEYGCLYMYTNRTADFHEDDIPAEQKKQTGERMGLVREMIRYGELKSCTNRFYAGGTSRATVDETISLNLLRKVSRTLLANHAEPITQILSAGPNFATAPVQAAVLVFCHTDMEHDILQLPDFTKVQNYAQRKPVHEMEIGSCDRYRFIISPELAGVANAGAAVGSTGLYSTGGSNIDVYPVIVTGEGAWGDIALRGMDSFDMTDLKPGQKDKSDPHGQRGYVGAKFYSTAKCLNDGHMAVIECGATNLG